MDRLFVTGGARLAGSVRVSGAKNSALKLMAAALLAPGTQRGPQRPAHPGLRGDGRDARALRRTRHAREGIAELDATRRGRRRGPDELVRQMRASIVVLGPLLARCGRARVVDARGAITSGSRPIDLHVQGLERMGADDPVRARLPAGRGRELRGAPITLDYPSVGATENLLFAAVARAGHHGDRQRRARAGDRGRRDVPRRDGRADRRAPAPARSRSRASTSCSPTDTRAVPDRIEAGTFGPPAPSPRRAT